MPIRPRGLRDPVGTGFEKYMPEGMNRDEIFTRLATVGETFQVVYLLGNDDEGMVGGVLETAAKRYETTRKSPGQSDPRVRQAPVVLAHAFKNPAAFPENYDIATRRIREEVRDGNALVVVVQDLQLPDFGITGYEAMETLEESIGVGRYGLVGLVIPHSSLLTKGNLERPDFTNPRNFAVSPLPKGIKRTNQSLGEAALERTLEVLSGSRKGLESVTNREVYDTRRALGHLF